MTTLFLLEVDNQRRQLPEEVAWGGLGDSHFFFCSHQSCGGFIFRSAKDRQKGGKGSTGKRTQHQIQLLELWPLTSLSSFHKFINDGGLWNILLVEDGQKVAVGLFSWRRNAAIDLVDKGKIVTVHLVVLLSSQVLFAIHLVVWLSFYESMDASASNKAAANATAPVRLLFDSQTSCTSSELYIMLRNVCEEISQRTSNALDLKRSWRWGKPCAERQATTGTRWHRNRPIQHGGGINLMQDVLTHGCLKPIDLINFVLMTACANLDGERSSLVGTVTERSEVERPFKKWVQCFVQQQRRKNCFRTKVISSSLKHWHGCEF